MEATSTRHATSAAAQEVMPACPHCGTAMIVRAQRVGDVVQGLHWACRRSPGCSGSRRIKSPDHVRPIAHDGSLQAIFDWQQARETGSVPTVAVRGLRGFFGRGGPSVREVARTGSEDWDGGHFRWLIEHGFVVMEHRAVSSARVKMDNVVVGPSGVFVVERKNWPGQISATSDSIYVDGRQRPSATDEVVRATAALEQTLAHELKPVGATVRGAILFEQAANKAFEGSVGKVLIGGPRGIAKLMRGTAEPVLGPETVVRLALAADRLLE